MGNTAKQTFNELLKTYQPLIRSVARKYAGQADQDDLVQAGQIGLWEAERSYDSSKGTFPAWVKLHVKRAVHDEVRRAGRAIRLPNNQHQAVTELRRAASTISASGRAVTGEALSEELEKPLEHVVALSIHMAGPESLDATQELEGAEVSLHDKLGVLDGGYSRVEFFNLLDAVCTYLTSDERQAFMLRFGLIDGLERSYREVGQETGTSAYLAQKRVESALAKLRHPAIAQGLAA